MISVVAVGSVDVWLLRTSASENDIGRSIAVGKRWCGVGRILKREKYSVPIYLIHIIK